MAVFDGMPTPDKLAGEHREGNHVDNGKRPDRHSDVLCVADGPGSPGELKTKGIAKFIAYEIPLELAVERYGRHFNVVEHDLHESDDLRVLDYDGSRAFNLFRFGELSAPVTHEPEAASDD